jgi:hypothetical protein
MGSLDSSFPMDQPAGRDTAVKGAPLLSSAANEQLRAVGRRTYPYLGDGLLAS